MAKAIRITLETLYDILINEKKREDLQKLEGSFYQDVVDYLKEKGSRLALGDNKEIFSFGEREKLEYELRSIKRILKEIYDKREQKIISISLNRSRTGSDLIDTSSMLYEENLFYQQMLNTLNSHRRNTLLKLFNNEIPSITDAELPKIEEKEYKKIEPEKKQEIKSSGPFKIRFIRPTPSFVWKDFKVYGPYESGDEIEIFPEVADLLIRKNRAEKI